jgi:hypothetical protein
LSIKTCVNVDNKYRLNRKRAEGKGKGKAQKNINDYERM